MAELRVYHHLFQFTFFHVVESLKLQWHVEEEKEVGEILI
jgi:hypothetical protein